MQEAAPLAPKLPETLDSSEYRIAIEPSGKRVRVVYGGQTVADSNRALVLRETRLPPVYYLPRDDIAMQFLQASEHRTYCPFKGTANYWHVAVDGKTVENAAWSYEDPIEEALGIRGYVAFYWNKVDTWFEDNAAVEIDPSDGIAEHANPLAAWMLREAWEATSSAELLDRLGRQLVEAGFGVSRMNVIIPTLHPQMASNAFVWRRGESVVDERDFPHYGLQSEAYLNSPVRLIFDGAGGIRRRLEGSKPRLDFPILEELQEAGATDYVAMPMRFSNGKINAFTLATDRPGGFTTEHLGQMYEVLPILSRLLEVHAMHRMSRTLLDTYLGAYTGQRVLNGLIKRGDGENIPAVVWYCDLRGSTALADSVSRDDYLDLINRFFEAMAGAVMDRGGEVLKFIGDGLLAIFPMEKAQAPESGGEAYCGASACKEALEAARDAVGRMQEVNAALAEEGRAPLRFGLALHLGDVTYGNIGGQSRLDFTVIGPATNEAARIDHLTKELGIAVLVSEDFERYVTGKLTSLGFHRLRGVTDDMELFTLPELAPAGAAD